MKKQLTGVSTFFLLALALLELASIGGLIFCVYTQAWAHAGVYGITAFIVFWLLAAMSSMYETD